VERSEKGWLPTAILSLLGDSAGRLAIKVAGYFGMQTRFCAV